MEFGLQDLSGSEERFERPFLRENLRHTTTGVLPDSGNTMVIKKVFRFIIEN